MCDVEELCWNNSERRAFAEETHARYVQEQRKLAAQQKEIKEQSATKLWKRTAQVFRFLFLIAAVVLLCCGFPWAGASAFAMSCICWYFKKILEDDLR